MQENFLKKIHQKIEGEREGNNPFCEGKLCKEWKSEWQIYSKMMILKRNKIKKIKGRGRVILRQNVWGDEKIKGRKKVKESVNVKKMSII